jgi:hypothetical protein
VKLVHLVGFVIKKFVTTHGHMNVKKKIVRLIAMIDFLLVFVSFWEKSVYRSLGPVCMKSVGHKLKISHHNCELLDNILYGIPKHIVRTKLRLT